jgi:hypothetical protein
MSTTGERGHTDPRKLPHDVAKACVVLAQVPEFESFAAYLDTLCQMYTAHSIWTKDDVDVARGRAQAINALLTALGDAPKTAHENPKIVTR